jgi:hypothetical protein
MHSDCNGDGEINYKDTSAITRNYKNQRETNQTSITQGIPIAFNFQKDTLYAGDTAIISITVGSTAFSDNLNGLAFSYEFTNELVKKGLFSYTWEPGYFNIGQVRLNMHRQVWSGYGEASISRMGANPVAVNYPILIAQTKYILKDSIDHSYAAGGEWLKLSFFNWYALEAGGQRIPLTAQDDSVLVFKARKKDTTNSVRRMLPAAHVKIYPNPAKGEVFIESGDENIREIKLVNMVGEIVGYARPATGRTRLLTSQLARGMYIVEISTDKGVATHKLLLK